MGELGNVTVGMAAEKTVAVQDITVGHSVAKVPNVLAPAKAEWEFCARA
jgi:hypothetical protein